MRRRAAKGRKLFSLAAVCFLVAAVLAPTPASASRTLPRAIAPDLERLPVLELAGAAGAGEAEPLPLYTFVDVVALDRVAGLDDDQVEAAVGRQRHRLHLVSSELARPGALVWGSKTATGVSTWLNADKHLEGSDLRPKLHRPSFQGLWTDPVSGLSYARNRWYDARSSSWLSEDPMGAVDSVNLYAFVGWGPQGATDPMGRQSWTEFSYDENAGLPVDSARRRDLEALHQGAAQMGVDAYGNPYVQGTLQLAGGCSTAAVGAVLAAAPEPGTTAAGIPMLVYGSDVCATGVRTIWTAHQQKTMTNFGLRKLYEGLGFSADEAQILADQTEAGLAIVIEVSGARKVFLKPGTVSPRTGGTRSTRPTTNPPVARSVAGIRGDPATYYSHSELKLLIKEAQVSGRGLGLEAHHLLEKRYASLVGVSKDDIISAAATPQWHRNLRGMGDNLDALITRRLKQMGTSPSKASLEDVWEAHRYVYTQTGHYDWAEAIYRAYFEPLGVLY